MLCFSIIAFAASIPTTDVVPSCECGSVCPAVHGCSPSRGARPGEICCELPGTASYSAYPPSTGPPRPCDQVAANAVGMPPEPSSTSHPSARNSSTYARADLYSRQAGSAKFQMRRQKSEYRFWLASIHATASA